MQRPKPTFLNLPPDKQERITAAAIEEFAEKGFHGASINEIVKRLKIAKGSIFQYFGDKKGLFHFVFNRCLKRVRDYLRQVRDETRNRPISERLTRLLIAGVWFVRRHPLLYRLYVQELSCGKTAFSSDLSAVIRRQSQEFLVSLIADAREKGELPAGLDMDTAGFVLDAVMDRFLRAHMTPDMDPGLGLFGADEQKIEARAKTLVGMVLNGICDCPKKPHMPYILVCGAVSEELKDLVCLLEGKNTGLVQDNGFAFAKGRISDIFTVILQTGPGAVNAAFAVTAMIERMGPPALVLQTGCGGAFAAAGLGIGDIAVACEEIDAASGIEDENSLVGIRPLPFPLVSGPGIRIFNRFPVDTGLVERILPGLYEIFSNPGEKGDLRPAIVKGPFITVSTITSTDMTAERLFQAYEPCMEQMEGAATARVAMGFGIPFLEIRCAANLAGRRDRENWNIPLAARRCAQAVSGIIAAYGKDLVSGKFLKNDSFSAPCGEK